MRIGGRVKRVSDVLDRVPRRLDEGDPLPDALVPFAVELRAAHAAVEHARQQATFDELDGGLWDRLREDAFFAAHRFAIEARRLHGEDVSWRERQLEQWQEWRAAEAAVPHAELVAAATVVEPELEAPEATESREARRMLDNRLSMVDAVGRPSREHREWAKELRRQSGRTL